MAGALEPVSGYWDRGSRLDFRESYRGGLAEPRALLVALGCFVGAAVVAVALAIKLHRITDLLAALWPDVPHQWRIAEAEARGEAPN